MIVPPLYSLSRLNTHRNGRHRRFVSPGLSAQTHEKNFKRDKMSESGGGEEQVNRGGNEGGRENWPIDLREKNG